MIDVQNKASTEDIIRKYCEDNNLNFDSVYKFLSEEIKGGQTRILRYSNTLLVMHILEEGVAEVHLMSLDQPREIVEAIREFYKSFQVAGFRAMVGRVEGDQIVRLIQMANLPISFIQNENGEQSDQFVIEVTK
jgi:phosphomevalonate kinase